MKNRSDFLRGVNYPLKIRGESLSKANYHSKNRADQNNRCNENVGKTWWYVSHTSQLKCYYDQNFMSCFTLFGFLTAYPTWLYLFMSLKSSLVPARRKYRASKSVIFESAITDLRSNEPAVQKRLECIVLCCDVIFSSYNKPTTAQAMSSTTVTVQTRCFLVQHNGQFVVQRRIPELQ